MYEFISSAEHKRGYFEESGEPNSFWSPLTSISFKVVFLFNGDQEMFSYLFSKSSFVFSRSKKRVQVWNILRLSNVTEVSCFGELSLQ